jgi:hypothetical protein
MKKYLPLIKIVCIGIGSLFMFTGIAYGLRDVLVEHGYSVSRGLFIGFLFIGLLFIYQIFAKWALRSSAEKQNEGTDRP